MVALATAHTLPMLVWSDIYFDADQAVVGLMAKHIAEGRALPVFQYGATYVLMIEAWLIAPLMWIADSSVVMVKVVPAALSVAAAGLLYWMFTAHALAPSLALVAAAPLALPGIAAAHELTTALGMSIEPVLFTLLIWLLRQRPIALGIAAALAVKNREFALYAIAALLVVDVLRDRSAALWRPRLLALVAFAAAWSGVQVLARAATPYGPGTDATMIAGDHLGTAAAAVCVAPERMPADVARVAFEILPFFFGVRSASWAANGHPGTAPPDASWFWWPLMLVLACAAARGLHRAWQRGPGPITWLGAYLVLVGLEAIVVYALTRCGNASVFTMRYLLLAVLLPCGALALGLEREHRGVARTFIIGTVVFWLVICAAGYAAVARGFLRDPPVDIYRALAEHLEAAGIQYIMSDYWAGYKVAFLTGERVKPATNFDRIHEYALAVEAHRGDAVEVRRRHDRRCPGGVEVGAFYVCGPPASPDP